MVVLAMADAGAAGLAEALRAAGLDVLVDADLSAAPGRPAVLLVDLASASRPAVAELRLADPLLEVVVVAPPERLPDAVALLRAGASDVLVSPVEASVVAAASQRALARREAFERAARSGELARMSLAGRVAGTVAHEIANAVAVLSSALTAADGDLAELARIDALLQGAPEAAPALAWWGADGRDALAEAAEAVREAGDAAVRLNRLARDLRTLARPDAGEHATVDLAAAVDAAVHLGRPIVTAVARLAVEVPRGASSLGSSGATARAVLELLLRSAEAFERSGVRRGAVSVAWRAEPGWAVLEITDDAPAAGDAGLQPRRAHTLAGAVALARELAERQGGALIERPRAGGPGTTFELRLRAAR